MFPRIRSMIPDKRAARLAAAGVLTVALIGGGAAAWWPHQGPALAAESPALAPVPSFAPLVERVAPAVVNIRVTKVEPVGAVPFPLPEGGSPEGMPWGEWLERVFRMVPPPPGGEFRMQGAGSGFIISKDGYVLTNNHVVDGAREITVALADKREFPATVVGRDPKTDLAVLRIQGKGELPIVAMGDSQALKIGEWVVAIGNPFGLSNTVTVGIVSAKGRVIGQGPYDDFIQTDAAINPGNSGGPLFNLRGEVIGINTAIHSGGQGIGFAIPINTAKALLPELEKHGAVRRGWLGVSIQGVTAELAKSLGLADQKGALVADVVPGSPADRAGIRRGDVIVEFDGTPIESVDGLPALVARTPEGRDVPVAVLRDGTRQVLATRVKRTADDPAAGTAEPARGEWGLGLRGTERGVEVASVAPGSPAERAGLRRGDVIEEVNRTPVASVQEVKARLDRAGEADVVMLLLKRGEGRLFTALSQKG